MQTQIKSEDLRVLSEKFPLANAQLVIVSLERENAELKAKVLELESTKEIAN